MYIVRVREIMVISQILSPSLIAKYDQSKYILY